MWKLEEGGSPDVFVEGELNNLVLAMRVERIECARLVGKELVLTFWAGKELVLAMSDEVAALLAAELVK